MMLVRFLVDPVVNAVSHTGERLGEADGGRRRRDGREGQEDGEGEGQERVEGGGTGERDNRMERGDMKRVEERRRDRKRIEKRWGGGRDGKRGRNGKRRDRKRVERGD